MEPAPGRRLFRPRLTLVTALAALAAVARWGDAPAFGSYALFVAVTAAVLAAAAVVVPARR